MIREQLEHTRDRVEAQMRWAVLHGGDEELLSLLRVESDRLSMMIGQCSESVGTRAAQQRVPISARRRSSHEPHYEGRG
jgi:hypothetical protein